MALRDIVKRSGHQFDVDISRLVEDPDNQRTIFDEESIVALAHSMVDKGQLTPIVIQLEGDQIIIHYGHRRKRAAEYVNAHPEEFEGQRIDTLKAVQGKKYTDLVDKEFDCFAENCDKEPLHPMDQARLFDKLTKQYGLSNAEIGRRINRSGQYVSDKKKLLELDQDLQDAVTEGKIGATAATRVAKSRKEAQKDIQERIENGEDISIDDVDKANEGHSRLISAKKIKSHIQECNQRIHAARKGSKELERWEGVKWGLETALGMHEW